MVERNCWPYQTPEGEEPISPLVPLGEGQYDVVQLFESADRNVLQDAKTVADLLKTVSGDDYVPTTYDALNAIQAATRFFDIKWEVGESKGGYRIGQRFTDHPVGFQDAISPSHREIVEPLIADRFASENPGMRRLSRAETEEFFK